MGRLIDADRLKAHYCWWEGGSREMTIDEAKKTFDTIIDLQPTVEREQGHWIIQEESENGRLEVCSNCNQRYFIGKAQANHYCPNCGAKMDKGENDD